MIFYPYVDYGVMADATITVEAGACLFKTVVIASVDDEMNVVYKIKSECPEIRAATKGLETMSLIDVVTGPPCDNVVYKACSRIPHAACPVVCAMVKAAEAAGELALKKDVTLKFE